MRNIKVKSSKGEKEDSINQYVLLKSWIIDYDENNQGILIYSENRLVKRFENNQFGTLDFLIGWLKSNGQKIGEILNHPNFDLNGFVALNHNIKKNIIGTVIIFL